MQYLKEKNIFDCVDTFDLLPYATTLLAMGAATLGCYAYGAQQSSKVQKDELQDRAIGLGMAVMLPIALPKNLAARARSD